MLDKQLTAKQFGTILLFLLFYEYVGKFLSLSNSRDTLFLLTIFLTGRYVRLQITPPQVGCRNGRHMHRRQPFCPAY